MATRLQQPPSSTSTAAVENGSNAPHDAYVKEDDLEPTAGLSSAASCIKITLLGYAPFLPVYTHQCFEGEHIPGWSPTDEAQNEARKRAERLRRDANIESNDTKLPHSSYRNHKDSNPRLEINVTLSPDCTRSSVTTKQMSPPSLLTAGNTGGVTASNELKKRPIADTTNVNGDDSKDELSSSATKRQKPSVSFADQHEQTNTNATAVSSIHTTGTPSPSSLEKMDIKDILSNLRRALPNMVEMDGGGVNSTIADGYLQKPFGTILHEYKRNIRIGDGKDDDKEEGDFVVTMANGSDKAVAEYHNKVQGLAMFFIETADNVDLSSDEGGGYWKVMYLFRRHTENKYSLVGYTTLFHFNSPFKKPKPGIVLRICQALVLPPYQRGGHGSTMLRQVYNYAEGRYDGKLTEQNANMGDDIVEVNVEDPAPGFVALRNKIDYLRFNESSVHRPELVAVDRKYLRPDVETEEFWLHLPESEAVSGAAKLRITPQQIFIAHEIFKLNALETNINLRLRVVVDRLTDGTRKDEIRAMIDEKIEGLEKKYRLMVKKRLLKVHREELGACGGKEQQKARLGAIFEETLRHYRSLLYASTEKRYMYTKVHTTGTFKIS